MKTSAPALVVDSFISLLVFIIPRLSKAKAMPLFLPIKINKLKTSNGLKRLNFVL
jgi:hypothetical protein